MKQKEEISFSKRTIALLKRSNATQAKMLDRLICDFLSLNTLKQKTALALLDDFSNLDNEDMSSSATLFEADPVDNQA